MLPEGSGTSKLKLLAKSINEVPVRVHAARVLQLAEQLTTNEAVASEVTIYNTPSVPLVIDTVLIPEPRVGCGVRSSEVEVGAVPKSKVSAVVSNRLYHKLL
jgi:hypothetical protein